MAGMVFIIFWWPSGYPQKSDLTKISGAIEGVRIKDDISGTGAGAMLPGITSVHFKLKGVPGEFRYLSSHPRFFKVRDYTAQAIDIWIDKADLGAKEAALIWQIRERNDYDEETELTNITFDEVIDRLTSSDRSKVTFGYWLLAASLVFLLPGLAVKRWNRGRAPV